MKPVWKRSLWVSVVMAGLGSAPVTAESVECDGVGWPLGYVPVTATHELPSHRLGLEAKIEFPVHRLPPVDTQTLLEEDEANTGWGKPPRVGINRPLIDSLTGNWYDLPDGGRLWTASIVATGASELRLHFVDVNFPLNAEIYVYSPQDPDRGVGPYAEAGPLRSGHFWAGAVTGDTAHVEYYAPNGDVVTPPFSIDEVGHMYRSVGVGRGARSWSDCMVNVPCEPDWPLWRDVSYSVARITFYSNDPPDPAGWYICTGQLLATLNTDLTPYFLTSAHCIDEQSEADSVQFRWFYQHSSCGGGFMSSIYRDDAELLGTSGSGSGADWSLLMVKGVLPPNVFWSGWMTTNPASGTWSAAVHHPNNTSDWKRWSRGKRYAGPWSNYHEIHFDAAGSVGHIYYGSSGSGIWRESDQKLFGNLSFGVAEPGCDHLSTDAYYGRFANYYSSISSYLAAGSDDTLEDNDSCANAATLDNGSYNDLVVKSLDEDWYRISLGQNQELDLDLFFTDSYGNINAQLYDECGGSVVASGVTYTNNEYLSYVNAGPAADFYLRVFLYDDTRNAYDIDCTKTGDGRPPSPSPMTFATPPYGLDRTSIHMVASTATDLSSPPVEYYFDFVSGGAGGSDGDWQTSTEYTDDGLQPDTNYCYRIKARDSAPVPNETEFSATQCADTMPLVLGDFDNDDNVDQDDYDAFANCFTGDGGGPVGADCAPGDFNDDGDVDCDDWEPFVLVWTGPPDDPDQLQQCRDAIPTVSEWGLGVMMLLVCTVGTLVFRCRRIRPAIVRC